MGKKTVVLGASTNPARYSYVASEMLQNSGNEIVPVGLKKGKIFGKEILDIRAKPDIEDIDTVTLYMNPFHQALYYDYILNLNPKRIIFNPGTENEELKKLAENERITTLNACTLVLISTKQY